MIKDYAKNKRLSTLKKDKIISTIKYNELLYTCIGFIAFFALMAWIIHNNYNLI